MPFVGDVTADKVIIYGIVRDYSGAPVSTNIAFIPIAGDVKSARDKWWVNTAIDMKTIIVTSGANGKWELAIDSGGNREFIVAIFDTMNTIRIPTEPGKYELGSLILE